MWTQIEDEFPVIRKSSQRLCRPRRPILFGRWMRAREIRHAQREEDRVVGTFASGTEFIAEHVNGGDPRVLFGEHAERVMAHSEDFYALPAVSDYRLAGDRLTWTSAIETPSSANNLASARLFTPNRERKGKPRAAVVVLPQWNAEAHSHVEACRIFNGLGMTALRLTLPYHEERRPRELERADHLVGSNIGRTIQSMRQAVLATRSAVRWLQRQGFERIGILGTSIGSCIGFLTFAHDAAIDVGVFNHVSGYVADVVWHGISTKHVPEGIENDLAVDELREFLKPINTAPFIPLLLHMKPRPMRFISARYGLPFPVDLS